MKLRRHVFLLAVGLVLTGLMMPVWAHAEDGEKAPSSPVSLEVHLDRYQATLGDLVTYTVTVWHEASIEPRAPEFPAIEGLERVDRGRRDGETKKKLNKTEFWIQYRADAIGKILFPRMDVPFTVHGNGEATEGTASTWQLELEVQSILRLQGEPTDIRDIKPVLQAGRDWLPILFMVLVCAGLLAFVYFLWRRAGGRRAQREATSLSALLPHERALKDLDALKARGLLESGELREYHFQLSEIFRRYLQDRFAFPALDWTTEEIAAYLYENPVLGNALRKRTDAVLRQTDRVKFARSLDDAPADPMPDVVQLIRSTAPDAAPADAPETAARL